MTDVLQAAAEQVAKLHPGGIDVLINNAGIQEDITRGIETYDAWMLLTSGNA